ncbi:chromate transporter [Garciella nitratireducens]|uniref:chromate transporter n=1 Tax=Garciella nitratireducens TaxID=218205 RepID=UPI001BD3A77B|nr:chromate transporter [Garciella nitratireducens]
MSAWLNLLFTFLKIGAFGFGGGYAMLSLMQKEVVDVHLWLTRSEFLDIVAIAEMTPGPIAINMATFVGHELFGFFGAIIATIGVVLPSFIIVLILVHLFLKIHQSQKVQSALSGIRPVILALIASAAISLAGDAIKDVFGVFIVIISFVAVVFKKVNPIIILVLSGIAGVIIY